MGKEAVCNVSFAGKTWEAKALLETDEILVRGTPRIVIRRGDITRAQAKDGKLVVESPAGRAVFALGAQAQKWADDLANPKSRLDKLGAKPAMKVVLLGVTDDALPGELVARGIEPTRSSTAKGADLVLLQIDDAKDLARIAKAAAQLASAGGLWAITPRATPGLMDTDVMRVAKAAGLVDVKVVRFNDTHTALKLVVPRSKRA